MAGQQGDVLLTQTVNDGDIESVEGQIIMTCGLETAVYLSMFGGADWWGDLQETDPDRRHPSETEQLIESIPAIPANLRRIEQAALRDLAMFLNRRIASRVEVTASIPDVDRIELQIIIEARGQRSEFNFVENWECSTNTGGEFEGAGADTTPPVRPLGHTNLLQWEVVATTTIVRPWDIAVDQENGDVYLTGDGQGSGNSGTDIEVLRGGTAPLEIAISAADNIIADDDIEALAIDSVNKDIWIGGQNQLFVFRGGNPPAFDTGWNQSNIDGLAVNSATHTLYIAAPVQIEVQALIGGLSTGSNFDFQDQQFFNSSAGRNSPRDVQVDSETGEIFVLNYDNNPVEANVWFRSEALPNWALAGGSANAANGNAFSASSRFGRDETNGDLWVVHYGSFGGAKGVYHNAGGVSEWVLAGATPTEACLTMGVHNNSGDLWTVDVLTGIVYRSPGVPL